MPIPWIAVLLTVAACFVRAEEAATAETLPEAQPVDPAASVVHVASFDSKRRPIAVGSGFFVGDGKAVVTNAHVVAGSATVRVRAAGAKAVEAAGIYAVDWQDDLALLAVANAGAPLALRATPVAAGEAVVTYANPAGEAVVRGATTVNSIDGGFLAIGREMTPGNSGGPVVDEGGAVAGVATYYTDGVAGTSIAIPVGYLAGLMGAGEPQPIEEVAGGIPKGANVDERITVRGGDIDGCLGSSIQATLVNGTDRVIRGVLVSIVYYDYRDSERATPLHAHSVRVPEPIEPGASKLFFERDSMLYNHGNIACGGAGAWAPHYRILDYVAS